MNTILRKNAVTNVSPSQALQKNTRRDRNHAAFLSPQLDAHEKQRGSHKHPIPPKLLSALLTKLISLLKGENARYPQKKTAFKRNHWNKQKEKKKQ